MKAADQDLIDLLSSDDEYLMADLFKFTLVTGDVYRWTTADVDIAYGGYTYKSGSTLLQRGNIKNTVGIEVDSLSVTFYPGPTDTINNLKFGYSILSAGFFDGAKLDLRKCFLSDWSTPVGALILFMGTVSDIKGSGTQIDISVKSKLETLNTQTPRNLYQTSCLNTVYDSTCGATKTLTGGSVVAGTKSYVTSTLTEDDDYFRSGVLTFTSGLNTGIKRTVKSYASGKFTFSLPLPCLPSEGDYFTVYPGCDGTMDTCTSRFDNILHFRGFPYIPVPETSL